MTYENEKNSNLLLMCLIPIFLIGVIVYNLDTSEAAKEKPKKARSGRIDESAESGRINRPLFLGRGKPLSSRNIADIMKGIVKPNGGDATVLEHRDGNTESQYSSWVTIDVYDPELHKKIEVILGYSRRNMSTGRKQPGYLVFKKIDPFNNKMYDISKIGSGDVYREFEILVKGEVTGCYVYPVNEYTKSQEVVKYLQRIYFN